LPAGWVYAGCLQWDFSSLITWFQLMSWVEITFLQTKTQACRCRHSHTKFGTTRQMMHRLVSLSVNYLDLTLLASNTLPSVVCVQPAKPTRS
jgi:hypothetical protein